MDFFIKEFKDCFSEEFSNTFLKTLESSEITPERSKYNFDGVQQEYKDLEANDELKDYAILFREIAEEKFKEYIKPFRHILHHEYKAVSPGIVKLPAGCPLPLHYDPEFSITNKTYRRHFVCLVYFQKIEGGELYFPFQKKKIETEPGLFVFFPCSIAFPHGVIPSKLEDRYTYRFDFLFD